MPTWASAPIRSSSATSSGVVMPPAAVTRTCPGSFHGLLHQLLAEPGHSPFVLHLCEEESANHRGQLPDAVDDLEGGFGPPPLHHDPALLGIHRRDDPILGKL